MTTQYQPKTGQPCHCKPGQQRDNCPDCEGTGQRIDFAAIRARTNQTPALSHPLPLHQPDCPACGHSNVSRGTIAGNWFCNDCSEVFQTPAPAQAECPECREWRDAIAALIQSLPQPNRQLVCAKLAMIPSVWAKLNGADRLQASLIVAKADEIKRVQEAAPALLEALKDVFAMMDEGWLVRDTKDDSAPGWSIRQLKFVQRLAAAQAAIALAGGDAK